MTRRCRTGLAAVSTATQSGLQRPGASWLFLFGLLVIRSGYIPCWLGILLMIAGAAYVVSAGATLIATQYAVLVGKVALPLEVAELPIVIWLVIWGARPAVDAAPAPG